MSDSNCICFQCKRPLIEMDSYGQQVWGCLNCKLWWLVRDPGRRHLSQEQLRSLNQAPNQMPCSASTEFGDSQGVNSLTAALAVSLLKDGG